jgi:hypothetical protein
MGCGCKSKINKKNIISNGKKVATKNLPLISVKKQKKDK